MSMETVRIAGIATPVIGVSNYAPAEPLRGPDAALGSRLTATDLRQIDTLLAQHDTEPVGPGFMAPPARRHSVPPAPSPTRAAA